MAQIEPIEIELTTIKSVIEQSFTDEHLVEILRKKRFEIEKKRRLQNTKECVEIHRLTKELEWIDNGIKRYG